ncbi:sensory rhodopsin transducer [Klebsiella pneumoniae]|nr:sensory rhodopsin transducer [Klebsiella pneumoniae]TYW59252.1 sensory rhodopsin transducer [Klebsiella pneumoniae]SWP98254.1 Anabaena sensory rhodopsin transducer [Klebsiella pneumoniae]VVL12150.1 Anabaena sensory rhodopsin transducer [Klebsiella pneumoniae]
MLNKKDVSVGSTTWVIADGYIPPYSNGPSPEMVSHDSICMLNAGDCTALVSIYVYFTDREPAGPFSIEIPARRAFHQRINDLDGPEKIPAGTDYSLLIRSDSRIVVQHTRLDSRQSENALMTTIAYPVA